MIDGRNFRTITSGNWDVERRLAEMDHHGIVTQAISPMPELLSYWLDVDSARELGRWVNDWTVSMAAEAPDRLVGLGTVPLQDPDLAAAELSHLADLGLAGVEIGSNVNGTYLGDPRFADFFAEAERLDLAVFVHALKPTMMGPLGRPRLTPFIGFPTDTGLTVTSLVESGLTDRLPDLRLAFSHGGGTFPWLLARYQYGWSGVWNGADPADGEGWPAPRVDAPTRPYDVAKRFWYDALLFDRRAVRYLIDMVGADRVVLGTDYPYMPPETPVDATLRSLDLDEVTHRAIAWDNGWRFLGRAAPALPS